MHARRARELLAQQADRDEERDHAVERVHAALGIGRRVRGDAVIDELELAQAEEQAVRDANTETAAVLNLSSAVGAYGGFSIPVCYGVSISMTGAPETALYGFIVFYLTCMGLTWRYYWGHNAPMLS